MKSRDQISIILGALLILATCRYVSLQDEQDASNEQQHYCDMVKQKLWPDFKGSYKKDCPIVLTSKSKPL